MTFQTPFSDTKKFINILASEMIMSISFFVELDELKKEMKAALGNSDPTGQKLQVMFHLMGTLGVTYREPGNVLTTTLGSLHLKRKQTFMYLFDHGAEWRFKVRVHAINENADLEAEYPRIVETVGTPPRQYRSWH